MAAQQSLDFGTSAANDGESLFAAFTKIDANTTALYTSDGTITHVVTDVASAATCDIGAAATDRVRITGTVTITSLGTVASRLRFVHFSGALTLTHNATSLICIGGSNILTVAGDVAIFSSDASGNWRMLSFNRGASLATGDFSGPASATDNAVVRFDATTGKIGQNSIVSIDDSGNIAPVTTDTGALGTTLLAWADLFLASGATLHFADTDWVATHTAGILTVGTGDLRVTTAGTNTASVVTVGGTQTLTAKTLTSPTIGTSPTAAGATWTDLGTVTTADINGGTLDGVTIGGATAAAATVTTLTVNANANPDANDGAGLGTGLLGWSDLFLASGGLLNFANGDAVVTHSTGILTVSTGDLRVTTAGTNTASAVTVGGTQTLTAKTLTSPVIGTSPTAAGATWTDLGTVTTADINGGTIDGTTIGGASAAAGTFTTIGGTAITGTGLLTVSLAGNAARFLNTTDGASVQVARFEGDRATMADADEAYLSLMLSNDGGTQTEFARLTWVATDVNAATSVDGRLDFAVATAGTLADELQLDGTALSPSVNDGLALGTVSLGWADYHAATGHVWNVANGDAVITHSTGVFTVSTGDLRVTTAGTNTASAVTVGGTQTLTGKSVSLTTNTLTGSVTEFNTALGSADFGTFAAAQTDNAAVRADGTAGLLQTSALIISDTADLTAYDATNGGNPVFAFGASATERITVTPTYDSLAQTLDYVLFSTDVASATADKGLFRFSPDGTAVLDIDDGGINFAASKGISIAGTDILTDAAGTATLSNIDALDATTEATIEAAIDTLANLTSIQSQTITLSGSLTVGGNSSINGTAYVSGGTDVAVADGGTGASTASAARTNLDTEQLGVQRGVNTQVASYTAVLADAGQVVEMNVAGANTFTIPPNSSVAFATGTWINIAQYGAGATTITPGVGVTIRNRSGLVTAGQYALATVYKRATDEWVAGGDLTA